MPQVDVDTKNRNEAADKGVAALGTNGRPIGTEKPGISNIASAPLQLLADDAKEGDSRQRGQRQHPARFLDFDDAASIDVQRLSAVHGEKNRIFPLGHFDLDDRAFVHDDRAIGQDVRTNWRDHKRA